jgi:hypothetical protein
MTLFNSVMTLFDSPPLALVDVDEDYLSTGVEVLLSWVVKRGWWHFGGKFYLKDGFIRGFYFKEGFNKS